ncbi:hypothetical protein [Amycolatopsis eburnea]|uniref:Uncharacterized protein n=1 Tax=Amycolatopsis eburnea TaxID=2267691 RepID=A0A427TJL0_9PSEU|nr:hypothetical protein [Amycolatopsis eburnea]RSD23772.1 hypothetical protein EIY87_05135 [Amycolatopsis eburnea]
MTEEGHLPTGAEIRAWAYSGDDEPEQDWDILIAWPENLPVLLEVIPDPACPLRARETLLSSLYCMVGHAQAKEDFRETARIAAQSGDAWLETWARRVREILDHPEAFNRKDWCGFPGYATKPAG